MSASVRREITEVSSTVHWRQGHSHFSKLTTDVIKMLSKQYHSDQAAN